MNSIKQIFNGQANINFKPIWKISLIASSAFMVISILFVLTKGLNLSVDFEGGAIWKVPVADKEISVADVRGSSPYLNSARIQEVSDSEGKSVEIDVQVGTETLEHRDEIRQKLGEVAGVSQDAITEDTIGPTWGEQITSSAVRALIIFFIAVALYLAWSLEWVMALAALLAVVHDLILTAGVYSIFSFEVSPATVIAILTILGYSLYDTVVVFDKIRENDNDPLADNRSDFEIVNLSMNQVLMRSINTTFTTILPVISLLVVGTLFLNAEGISSFALALFIGLLLGNYSSIFFAAPILYLLRSRSQEGKKRAEIVSRRSKKKVSKPTEDAETVPEGKIKPKPRKKSKR